jgi:phosphatidylserine decarboxylase|tara:strand:+ start:10568 stop:11455 length:888 start_codon:yes stop_codon:yes gene_type:complete
MDNKQKEKLKATLFCAFPHHMMSRAVYFATRLTSPRIAQPMINWFIKKFNVDMSEAEFPDIKAYQTFNEFFTRPLKIDARPIATGDNILACPADGTVSETGSIHDHQIFQAKGHHYTVKELVGGDEVLASLFKDGRFATVYLAPYNYHRMHMPMDGLLKKMVHVPGRLFSVAQWTVRNIPRLFARNERLVCLFSTDAGPMVMVLVGAINVAAIETVWSGLVTPPRGKKISNFDYSDTQKSYKKGEEMGRFNMGSTVILLTPPNVEWSPEFEAGLVVKMGEAIGRFTVDETASTAP